MGHGVRAFTCAEHGVIGYIYPLCPVSGGFPPHTVTKIGFSAVRVKDGNLVNTVFFFIMYSAPPSRVKFPGLSR